MTVRVAAWSRATASGSRRFTRDGLDELYSTSRRPAADHRSPSWRACTTKLERATRGALHLATPELTKLAGTDVSPWSTRPKPHWSRLPVGAKLSPRSETVSGLGEATSTYGGSSEASVGGRSGSYSVKGADRDQLRPALSETASDESLAPPTGSDGQRTAEPLTKMPIDVRLVPSRQKRAAPVGAKLRPVTRMLAPVCAAAKRGLSLLTDGGSDLSYSVKGSEVGDNESSPEARAAAATSTMSASAVKRRRVAVPHRSHAACSAPRGSAGEAQLSRSAATKLAAVAARHGCAAEAADSKTHAVVLTCSGAKLPPQTVSATAERVSASLGSTSSSEGGTSSSWYVNGCDEVDSLEPSSVRRTSVVCGRAAGERHVTAV